MVYGSPNENIENGYSSHRQWFLSLDLNLEKIEVEKKWLKVIFKVINKVKIPFPAIEWDGKGIVLHPLYF